jgi:3-phenylpropionate/trans-cinnamate dioxygenase ferredoxin subunit
MRITLNIYADGNHYSGRYMGEFVKVAKTSDIGAGMAKGFTVNGSKVMVASVGGKYYAIEDRCTHMGAKLSDGLLMGNVVMCMAHGAQFDIASGAPLTLPGESPVKTYEVRVNGEDIEIKL